MEAATSNKTQLQLSESAGVEVGNNTVPEVAPEGSKIYKRILVWFRRDLRIHDNPALLAASVVAEQVVPVYIYAPEEEGQFQPGRCSRWWLSCSLKALDASLRKEYNTNLACYRGVESKEVLEHLVREYKADAVFFNHFYDPISMVRDNEVKEVFRMKNILCQSFNGDTLREPWDVVHRKDDGSALPFTCFDKFWEAHQSLPQPPPIPAPVPLQLCPVSEHPSERVMSVDDLHIMSPQEEASNAQLEVYWNPGRQGAMSQLEAFVEKKLSEFSDNKAKTDRMSTSKLSPHLHFGEIGVREVRHAIMEATATWSVEERAEHLQSFYKQLGFREYSRYLSFHFPFTHERSMLEHLRAVPWRYDQTLFKAWRTGNTGYPIIDAGMREIWSTGWMHNRCRVVCASFLVKNLLLPWQWGLKHFWDALLDADLECDALGWQYCAGCLSDGHEFAMVMNLEEEVKKFDPKGAYVRRWLPVLARLPTQYIHAPWTAPLQVLEDAGIELGEDYPLPVVHHDEAQKTLSKAADVVAQAEVHSSPGKSAGPYRPATVPLPESSSIIWVGRDKVENHGASSIASFNKAGRVIQQHNGIKDDMILVGSCEVSSGADQIEMKCNQYGCSTSSDNNRLIRKRKQSYDDTSTDGLC